MGIDKGKWFEMIVIKLMQRDGVFRDGYVIRIGVECYVSVFVALLG